MEWIKKGHIFLPKGNSEFLNSHTIPAKAIVLNDRIRVFYSSKSRPDSNGNFISYSSFVDLDKQDLTTIIYEHPEPIIETGGPGTFDEFGTTIAEPLVIGDSIYLYYLGWQRLGGNTAPYQVCLGLAIGSIKDSKFKKVSQGPVVGIDQFDPISIGNVAVRQEGGKWQMWYTSYKRWEFKGVKPTPEYHIKYAESEDGINWHKTEIICIAEDEAGGIATPTVIKVNDKYEMWFGYRKPYDQQGNVGAYKIGHASSKDGLKWLRDDENSSISVSPTGWDSQMVCYPHVVTIQDKTIMFYSGNDFGRSGFGYAELSNEND